MKKIIILIVLILVSGCYKSTPTKEVEEYFTNYQTSKININYDNIIDFRNYSDKQRNEYIEIINNNYNDLVYTIKNEEVNANNAIVTVEIEVYDFIKKLDEIEKYKDENITEFYRDEYFSESMYIDFKISQLKEVSDRIIYTLNIPLTKVDDKWYIDDLPKEYIEKINGIYKYY